MTVDEAAKTMTDLVNSDRPFTAQERAQIMAHIDAATDFLKTNKLVINASLLASHAIAGMCGFIIAKVFL